MPQRDFEELLFDVGGNLTTTGSSNAYTVQTAQSINGYYAGLWIRAKANHTNNGASTFAINGLPTAPIRKNVTDALTGGEIVSGRYFDLLYDEANSVFQLQNPALIDGAITTNLIANNAVTYAKMQDVSATARILGRKTSGAGDPEECTLSEVLDFIGSAAQGDILYRDASAWARLGAGTSGQFLQTQGTGANPQWANAATGMELLTSGSVSNAVTLDIVLTAYTAYRAIFIILNAFVPASDNVDLRMRVSTDGGSNYDATGYSYTYSRARDGSADATSVSSSSANQMAIAGTPSSNEGVSNVAAEGGAYVEIMLMGQTQTGVHPRVNFKGTWVSADAQTFQGVGGGRRETAQDTDAVRFLFESGNIASGNYAVYGLL